MTWHGAVFAEVKVDPDLGQMRVTRVVGAFAAGRIINPRMVQSQFNGGMIWGISFALHSAGRYGSAVRSADERNLAEYRVPVNADVPSLEAILVEEHDPHVNALGIKGVGEIGITGTTGASLTPSGTLRKFAATIPDHARSLDSPAVMSGKRRGLASHGGIYGVVLPGCAPAKRPIRKAAIPITATDVHFRGQSGHASAIRMSACDPKGNCHAAFKVLAPGRNLAFGNVYAFCRRFQ